MYAFQYAKPQTTAEALELLAADETNQPLAGGQTLIPTIKQRLNAPGTLVDLSGVSGLSGITQGDGGIVVGAMTTHAVGYNNE